MLPLVNGMTVTMYKSPPGDDVNFTWAFQGTLPPNAYKFCFYINQYPTFNCQVTSVAHMDYVLDGTNTREQALGALSEGFRMAGLTPKLILLDVTKGYMDKIDSYFSNYIRVMTPYESTNETKMCLYMVKMPPF